MSVFCGKWELKWKSPPRGNSGSTQVNVGGETLDIRWRRDADGLWLETPTGVYGFDVAGEADDSGSMIFRVAERGTDRIWNGVSFVRAGEGPADLAATGVKKKVRIRAQMPGKIVRVMTVPGAMIEKDQPIMVMEAMKMENEIRAPHAGQVDQIKVVEGQAVETGADLVTLL